MHQHAGLQRRIEPQSKVIERAQKIDCFCRAVSCRIDADDGIAAAIEQAVDGRSKHSLKIVLWMVWLKADRHASRQAECVAKARNDAAFTRGENQVLIAHQLGDGSNHLRSESSSDAGQSIGIALLAEYPLSQLAYGQMADGRKGCLIMRVKDETRHVVVFVRNDGVYQEHPQRHIGERKLCRSPFLVGIRGDPGQRIARAQRTRFGKEGLQAIESIGPAANCMRKSHGCECSSTIMGFVRRALFGRQLNRNPRYPTASKPANSTATGRVWYTRLATQTPVQASVQKGANGYWRARNGRSRCGSVFRNAE